MDKIMLVTAGIDISIYKSQHTSSCFNGNKENFVTGGRYTTDSWVVKCANAKFCDSACTTSNVLFNTTPMNVVPDGL